MNTPPRVDVYSHDRAEPRLAGTLSPSLVGSMLASSSFEYDPAFIRDGYALSPDLPLQSGRTYAPESTTLFGAFQDAAPDEWGQRIIQAAHTRAARREGERARHLGEFDFLLGVSDTTRIGALRMRDAATGRWLSADDAVANTHDLNRILDAARRYERHEATDEDIAYLNGVATSPGGARPKANIVTAEGKLAIAKLPHSKDGDVDVERWEAVALTLARSAGIRIAPFQVVSTGSSKAVLVVERFDRAGDGQRVPYMSAFSALGLGTHKTGSQLTYVDFADTIADLTGDARGNLHEMFARIALTTLISNADDHWRNHGFLRQESGWSLSPAFDINPSRSMSINSRRISDDADPDRRTVADLLDVADAFELTSEEAANAVSGVAQAVTGWPAVAASLGVPANEVAEMAVAFPEDQITAALSARPTAATTIDLGTAPPQERPGQVWVRAHPRLGGTVSGHWRKRPGERYP